MPALLIEGADLVGKSTAIRDLSSSDQRKRYEAAADVSVRDVRVMSRGPFPKEPGYWGLYDEYVTPIWSDVHSWRRHYWLMDRWHLGEFVYPPIVGRESQYSDWDDLVGLDKEISQACGPVKVVMYANDPDILCDRYDRRGDSLLTEDQIIDANDAYVSLLPDLRRLGWRDIAIDGMSQHEIISKLFDIWMLGTNLWSAE